LTKITRKTAILLPWNARSRALDAVLFGVTLATIGSTTLHEG
jgi:hypothetical protein